MTDEIDFDALARKTRESDNSIEDSNALYLQVFALPQWHFIARGQFPDVNPYIASNPQVADGQYMVRAFTDTDRLQRFAKENNLMGTEPVGKEDVLVLSVPTEKIVDYLEQFISQGVHGIWFNSDSQSYGFFAPLKQLRPIQEHLKNLSRPALSDTQKQIERWQRQEITDEQLLRAFVGHDNWLFFVAEGGVEKLRREGGVPDYVLQQNEGGEKSLYIFSDAEVLETYVRNSGINEWRCEVMTSAGADIFSTLPDYLSGVTINTATPLTVTYDGEQLKALRLIADAAFMERELKSLSDGSIKDQEELNRVVSDFRRYENFHLVSSLLEDGQWTYPRYASDERATNDDLKWVVAFTAADNANSYLRESAAQLPGRYRIERLDGLKLARIAIALNGPGILFNWLGHVAPLMLNSQFLKLVCDAQLS